MLGDCAPKRVRLRSHFYLAKLLKLMHAMFSRGLLVKSRDSILHQICRHISIGEIRRLGGQSVGSAFAPLGRELI